MIKTYEPETKRDIEQVIDVFNDYIRTSTHFELLWSDKVGYIYISIDNVQGSIRDTGCCVVNCGEELFDKLVWELAVDIMEEVGHTIDPTEADPSLFGAATGLSRPSPARFYKGERLIRLLFQFEETMTRRIILQMHVE